MLGRGESMCKDSGVAILDQTNPSVARVEAEGPRGWEADGHKMGEELVAVCVHHALETGLLRVILANHHAVRGC